MAKGKTTTLTLGIVPGLQQALLTAEGRAH